MSKAANPFDAFVDVINKKTAEANAIADANASQGKSAQQVKEIRETSEDARLVKFREWLEKQEAAILDARKQADEVALSLLADKGETWDEKTADAKKDEHKVLKKQIADAKSALATILGMSGVEMPEFTEVKNFGGSVSKSGGSGTSGISRPRFSDITLNGVSLKQGDKRATLTQVSQKVKSDTGQTVTAGDLFALLTEANGGNSDYSTMNDISIEFTQTDKDGVVHTYKVTVFKAEAEATPAA